jgi:hypothetical protein
VCPKVKERGECPHGHAHIKQGIGRLSHPRTHPHTRLMPRRHVSPNPLLEVRTLKGGGFGLTTMPREGPLLEHRSHPSVSRTPPLSRTVPTSTIVLQVFSWEAFAKTCRYVSFGRATQTIFNHVGIQMV